jgi:hypothetical protein
MIRRNFFRQLDDNRRRVKTHSPAVTFKAQLFEDSILSDKSPLIYLVPLTLHFHRAFQTLAHAITPSIEMYRFDINEDWRKGARVMRRERIV